MSYLFGIGDGILICFGIILGAILLCIVNGRSKGLSSVVTYFVIAVLFLSILLFWPVKGPDEPTIEDTIKTDIILIPRVIFLVLLPFFLIYLINLYVRHNLFFVTRAESTADRHGVPWLVQAKINNRR